VLAVLTEVLGPAHYGLFPVPVTIGAKAMSLDAVSPKPSTKLIRTRVDPGITVAWWLIMLRRITIIPVVVVVPIPGRTTGGRDIERLWVVVRRTSRMGPFITATLL
jgi:hypothetical protein